MIYLEHAASDPDPYPDALFALGDIYLSGFEHIQYSVKALQYFKEAGKLGHSEAICNVGAMHYNGLGTPVNFEKAFYAYQNASLLGSKEAHKNLHDMYSNGIGVPISEAAAAYHLSQFQGVDTEPSQFLPKLFAEVAGDMDENSQK